MPTSPLPFVLFLLVIGPGLAWVRVRKQRSPPRSRSTLRELADLAAVSVVFHLPFLTAAIAVAGLAWKLNTRLLIVDQAAALRAQPFQVLVTVSVAMTVAIGASWVVAMLWFRSPKDQGEHRHRSDWFTLVDYDVDLPVTQTGGPIRDDGRSAIFIKAVLEDESVVQGLLGSFTDEPGTEGRRGMVLDYPVVSQPTDGDTSTTEVEFNKIVINENRIRWVASVPMSSQAKADYLGMLMNARLKGMGAS